MNRGYGNDYMKDPRPVSDRGFKERSIRKLVDVRDLYSLDYILAVQRLINHHYNTYKQRT